MSPLSGESRGVLLRLARAAIAEALGEPAAVARVRARAPIPDDLRTPRGVFVTLRTGAATESAPAELRGCVGTLEAEAPLCESVIEYARHAAFRDPRFPPLTAPELASVTLEVSVLTSALPIGDPAEIVPGRDGVALNKDGAHSVFLPHVAGEHGWDLLTLLAQLARKAGLPSDGWRGAELRVFQAEVFDSAALPGGFDLA